jgi:hypothetical protein
MSESASHDLRLDWLAWRRRLNLDPSPAQRLRFSRCALLAAKHGVIWALPKEAAQ